MISVGWAQLQDVLQCFFLRSSSCRLSMGSICSSYTMCARCHRQHPRELAMAGVAQVLAMPLVSNDTGFVGVMLVYLHMPII